jgi:hypothetical protein
MRYLLGLLLALLVSAAQAQDSATVVQACGAVAQTYAVGSTRPLTVDVNGTLCGTTGSAVPGNGSAGYPPGSTPITSSTTLADTGGASLSLTPGGTQFAYVCGIQVNGLGATAATSVTPTLNTVTGANGTFTWQGQYTYQAGATVFNTPFERTFTPCLRGGTVGSAINFNLPGAAGNTSTSLQMWGYFQ